MNGPILHKAKETWDEADSAGSRAASIVVVAKAMCDAQMEIVDRLRKILENPDFVGPNATASSVDQTLRAILHGIAVEIVGPTDWTDIQRRMDS